ncbi:hypothetical protein LTR08_001299 [Meristemomyces frigidus]|nr:hypothetical protein LTR08_001299 [Meristemomyces frigidus]
MISKKRQIKIWALAAVLLSLIYLLTHRVCPAVKYHTYPRPHPVLLGNTTHSSPAQTNLTTNLVVASTAKDDISWTDNLYNDIPNLTILRYVSDSRTSRFHPPVAKGREALMYFTYLHDFYDSLPDVSVFIHAEETPWHLEGTLLQNISFALAQLDLTRVVEERGYFNLRVTWRAACPAWIDTRKTFENWEKQEEPYMPEAWEANFDDPVPDILAGPCCSQFAVSRAAIQRRPREQYKRSIKWLVETSWSDHIVGRVWEHMWPWLFKEEAKDCAPEKESLCQMYGICFENARQMEAYKELWEERERLKEDMSFLRASWAPGRAAEARKKMNKVGDEIERQLSEAWKRGRASKAKAVVER